MPTQFNRHWLVAFCIAIAFSICAHGAVPTVHISPAPTWINSYKPYDKKIPARDIEGGFFYQLIDDQIHVEKRATYSHVIREIVSQAGIQNGSEISISFDPSFERLDVHQITIWRNGKPQNKLNSTAFKVIADEQELSKFIYQGTYSAYCILSDVRKGDRIEYSYTLTGQNPIFGPKYCGNIYFTLSKPIAHLYKSIFFSPQRKLNFKSFNRIPKSVQTLKNGLQCYEWEDFQVKPAHDFNNQPGWYTSYSYLQISDYASWQEVADWASKINPLAVKLSGSLANQVARFKAEAGNSQEKYFRLAVKMVQDEVRYMGIETGEYSHRANTPERVYNQRYGDCKDKSLLLASVLNANGIPANIVLISTFGKQKTDQYLPSPFSFNHAVVVATVNKQQVWVDPTIAYQRGTGTNIYFPSYGKGLIVHPDSKGLTEIAPSLPGKVTCREEYKVLTDSGKVSLDVTTTYTAYEADKIRDKLALGSINETEKGYLDYYARIYPKIESQDSITVSDNEDANELTTVEHYMINDFFKKDSTSNRMQASFYANMINDQLPDISNNKAKYPVALNYPYNIDYTISLVMDQGWNIEEENSTVKKDAFTFDLNRWATNDTLFLNYKYSCLKDFIPVDQLDDYKAEINKIKDDMLSYGFSYAPGIVSSNFKFNYSMFVGILLFLIVLALLAVKIYHKRTEPIEFEPGGNFIPIGGWLVLIAFGLGLSVLGTAVTLCQDYFDIAVWNSHTNTKLEYWFKALFTFEALGNAFLLAYSLFCLLLLVNKRDILPRYITGLYLAAIAFFVVDYLAAKTTLAPKQDTGMEEILRAIIAAAIWIPYFRMSVRVQQTFIVPHPSTNYTYAEMNITTAVENLDNKIDC